MRIRRRDPRPSRAPRVSARAHAAPFTPPFSRCGTESGFRIYNVDPFKETFRRVFSGGGVGVVEMLFRCNLLALVGGGRSPRYPPNKVMIWDDHQNRCIGELSFRSDVKAVKLRRDRVVVVLATKVYVYRFSDLKLLDQINTQPNPRGLVALCPHPSNNVLACPGVNRGHVRVELYDARKSTIITAHESDLARLALSGDGALVATASDKGTLLRVFDTHTGAQLRELRRGVDRAAVYSIAFDAEAKFLACSSDKGTVHIFSLGDGGGARRVDGDPAPRAAPSAPPADAPANARSNLSFLRRVIPGLASSYLESEWSFAQVHGLDAPTLCAFGAEPGTVVVVGADGSFLVSKFADGGECERVSFAKFIRSPDEDDDAAAPWAGENAAEPPKPPPAGAAADPKPPPAPSS